MAKFASKRLGRTEMRPNAIGLGGAWWGAGSESDTIAGIERAIELGINFLDTYPGPNEERWGKALSNGRREKIYLQGKVSSHVQNSSTSDHTAAATRRSIESSLKGLRTDYLDCVLCMAAPVDGIVLPGPANTQQVEDAVEAGTADIPPEIWRDFKAEFGVGLWRLGSCFSACGCGRARTDPAPQWPPLPSTAPSPATDRHPS